jgi:hypothetical protein
MRALSPEYLISMLLPHWAKKCLSVVSQNLFGRVFHYILMRIGSSFIAGIFNDKNDERLLKKSIPG